MTAGREISYLSCSKCRLQGYILSIKNNIQLKTLGRQTARLVEALYDRSQTIFLLSDVEEITGIRPALASSLIHKAVQRGLVTRLKGGLYSLVPAELGSIREYTGDPYLLARSLAGGSAYFVSHASAMEIHRMVTQPQLAMFVSSTKRIRQRKVAGTEFRFVFLQPEHIFGTTTHWATKQQSVVVSDLERTIIDGLRQPQYCGGVAEVAKGLWMRHQDMNTKKLIDYALRLGVGAVIRRLGYILELYTLAGETELSALREPLTGSYVPLDPLLPREGVHLSRWRLQLNITADELDRIRSN